MTRIIIPEGQKPWDRLPKEGDKAWIAFQIFLNLPAPRRLQEVADRLGYSSKEMVARWSSRYGWTVRAGHYDNALMGIPTPQERDETLGMLQTNVLIDAKTDYESLREAWNAALDALMDSDVAPSAKELKDLADARKSIDLMARRMARMPTTIRPSGEEDGLKDSGEEAWYLDQHAGPKPVALPDGSE